MPYNFQAKEKLTMSGICWQKNLKAVSGMLYLGRGFTGGGPVFKACVFPASSLKSIPDQIAFYSCRATPHAFANIVIKLGWSN